MQKLNYRVVIFIAALIFGVVFSIPSLTQSESGKKITLGLDLQGGLHMLLGVKSDEAIKSRLKSIAGTVKYLLEDNDIVIDELSAEGEKVTFKVLDSDDIPKVKELLKKELTGVNILEDQGTFTITLTPQEVQRTKKQAIDQAVDTIRNRLDQFGLAEPTVAKQGEDKILVEVPGIKTPADEQRIRELIARAAHLQMMAVDEDRAARVYSMSPAEAKKYGDVILPDVKNPQEKYLLKAIPILDGSMLTDAKVGFDRNNQPVINFKLNGEGAKIFGDFSGKSVGKRMAIVLDNKVYSAPVIRERIGGGSGQISGNFTLNEANDVAIA
ncbi:MAG TPA: protein translocase subunit SecD, partial [Nitratifractor salsuginis]|nr:protein translocase subunit SecD [Nitratifractor salsuginis]